MKKMIWSGREWKTLRPMMTRRRFPQTVMKIKQRLVILEEKEIQCFIISADPVDTGGTRELSCVVIVVASIRYYDHPLSFRNTERIMNVS